MSLLRRRPLAAQAFLTVGVPVTLFVALAWNRRWMSDDGYINIRIVTNILDGHGPVFNAGERVEAGTSPLWIWILACARTPLWFLDAAWVAVLVGLALAALGLGLAIAGARCWWRSLGREATLPLGAGILLALPPMWDYGTSGLESGLSFAWIGACWWATARRLEADHPPPLHRPLWVPVLIGLGPLVRPDFVIFSAAFAVALVATSLRDRGAILRAAALGLALPVGYQIFRMGYYGLLVPNTALAKESGESVWGRGGRYLATYLDGTLVWLPFLLVGVVYLLALRTSEPSRRQLLVAGAPLAAAVLHVVYIVKVGGDHMFGRMLLPGTFALACPLAALPLPARQQQRALVAAAAAALVVIGVGVRWVPSNGSATQDGISDERRWWAGWSGSAHPVVLGDFAVLVGKDLERPVPGMAVGFSEGQQVAASKTVVLYSSIGIVSVARPDVHVADALALADPVGSHFSLPENRGMAGHEKWVPWPWIAARFGTEPSTDPDIMNAREALACGDLAELVDSVEDPLTPGRFLRNLVGAPERTTLRVPLDPEEAVDKFCD